MTEQKDTTEEMLVSVDVKPQPEGKGQGQSLTIGAESYIHDADDPDDAHDS